MIIVLSAVTAYLIGSFPTAFIITKLLKKVDIRDYGSGNPGATNVYRVAGPVPGIITFVIDFLKGFVPVLIAFKVFGRQAELYCVLIGVSSLLGHITMPFLGFKGGKGVATGSGVFLALIPVPAVIAFITFFIVLKLTKIVSVSSLSAALSLPISSYFLKMPKTYICFALIMFFVSVYTHRSNIKNIVSGQEYKFKKKEGKND